MPFELHHAIASKDLDSVKSLIKDGADLNETGRYGDTPLDLATEFNLLEIIALLIKNGANVNKSNSLKETSLHRAARYGNKATVELLIDNGARTDDKNIHGETPLDIATRFRRTDIAEVFSTKENKLSHIAASNDASSSGFNKAAGNNSDSHPDELQPSSISLCKR